MDWNKFNQEFRNVVDTGKIIYGTKNVKRNCFVGEPKLIVVSKTLAKHIKEEFLYFTKLLDINLVEYPESSINLGSVCGKPFNISIVSITDFGKSSIIDVVNSKDNENKDSSKVIAKREKKKAKEKVKKEKKAKIAAKKAEKELIDKEKNIEEEKEIPIREDEMFKDIIKIKKK